MGQPITAADVVVGDTIRRRGKLRTVAKKERLGRRHFEDYRFYFTDGGLPLDVRWTYGFDLVARGSAN